MLFAGTERSVYVSWDDGDHWQSLKLNLPPTSIRDLVIHGDDIVVGTHGRSFWILDNITPLRQLRPDVPATPAFLFHPQWTYRVRRNNNTDTPLPPEEPAGQNPPDGAMIDYWISSSIIAAPVTLDIFDEKGEHLIRHFSSLDPPEPVNPKELNVPMYWVRPSRTLSTAPGMHRFLWDLTYPAPDVLEHEYPISAIYHDTPRYPLGATVKPGNYKVVLTAGRQNYSQTLSIRMDPRVKVSSADLDRHFGLDRKIADALHRDYEALQQIRSLRAQLKLLPEKKSEAISKAAGALDAKAAIIEGGSGGYGAHYLSTPAGRSLSILNSGLGAVLSALDTADSAPTTQQTAMYEELDKALAEQLSAWEQLKSQDVPELSQQLKKAKLPPIDPQKPVPGAGDAAQTTTQDRDRNEE